MNKLGVLRIHPPSFLQLASVVHRYQRLVWVLLGLIVLVAGGFCWYRTTRPGYRLQQGQEALRRENPDAAHRIALSLESDGYQDHAGLLWGEMLFRQGAYAKAVAAMRHIQDQGAIRLEAAALSGQCLLRLLHLGEAERLLRFVVDQRPEHVEAHRGLADIYYYQGALGSALQHMEVVAQLDPRDGRPYQYMGYIYKDLPGDKARAIPCFQEALRRGLSKQAARAGVWQELLETLITQCRYAEALQVLEQGSPEAMASPKVVALRAEALGGLDRGGEAQLLLDQALKDHPRVPELLRVRAKLYLSANEPQPAAVLLERALEVDRHDHLSRFQLAQAYEFLGRAKEAAEQRRLFQQTDNDLAALTKLNMEAMNKPWDAAVRKRLAVLCENLGKADLAAFWLQAAASCPPEKP